MISVYIHTSVQNTVQGLCFSIELCVEDETLFDDTETGSQYTTNYSINTVNTYSERISSDISEDDINPPEFNFRRSLNLMEENPEQLFKDLYQFRKSIIAIRKGTYTHTHHALHISTYIESGILLENTASTAPPTDRSSGSYQRRVSRLDTNTNQPSGQSSPMNITIASPSHDIEGSRDFGVDDISAVGVKGTTTPQSNAVYVDIIEEDDNLLAPDIHKKQGSIGFVMHRTKSQMFASGDITFINDKNGNRPVLSTVNSVDSIKDDETVVNTSVDDDDVVDDDVVVDDGLNEDEYKLMEDRFSVQRSLSEPRGSMKVGHISVSSDMRDTLIHQRSISQAGGHITPPHMIPNAGKFCNDDDDECSSSESLSSLDFETQREIRQYVRRISSAKGG